MRSETAGGLSICSKNLERPLSHELESDEPFLSEMEHLRGKIVEEEFESLRADLNLNADVFLNYKADLNYKTDIRRFKL